MRWDLLLFLAFSALVPLGGCLGPRCPATSPQDGQPHLDPRAASARAQVESCHDGDTCTLVFSAGLRIRTRLAGIDAPEVANPRRRHSLDQPGGQAARQRLETWIVGQEVQVEQVDLDPYNRPVVILALPGSGEIVNETLVAEGLAEVYRSRTKGLGILASRLDAAEDLARRHRRGVWADARRRSPGDFRRAQASTKEHRSSASAHAAPE